MAAKTESASQYSASVKQSATPGFPRTGAAKSLPILVRVTGGARIPLLADAHFTLLLIRKTGFIPRR
jgi:hypothetical protein